MFPLAIREEQTFHVEWEERYQQAWIDQVQPNTWVFNWFIVGLFERRRHNKRQAAWGKSDFDDSISVEVSAGNFHGDRKPVPGPRIRTST
ncbi:Isopentenyldiphosphate isomerase [Apiospora arundinis]